jgi:N-acetylglutamate synthase-like GNAT family acetyltransferase
LVAAYNAEPWNDSWTIEKAQEKLICFYNSPKFIGLAAFVDGKLAGSCVGNIEPYYIGDYFYMKEMFVSPEFQHKGIGRRLMESMKVRLKKMDIETIILFTGKDFFPYDFYLKSGFSEMEGMRMMNFGKTE